MKKNTSLSAIIIIAFFTFMQFTGIAQSGFLETGAGIVLDQGGKLRDDGVYSLRAGAGVAEDLIAFHFEMSGGQRFGYYTNIKTMDFLRDSLVRRTTNTPFMQVGLSLCIPPGKKEDLNHFRGELLSVGGGIGFPDMNYTPTGIMKISLQGNYTGNAEKKLRIGCFARASFNFLFTGPNPLYSSAIEVGIRMEMYRVFSPE